MTGQEIIKYIEDRKLQDKHFFINARGHLSNIAKVLEIPGGDMVFVGAGARAEVWNYYKCNLERYFSEWFDIIPKMKAFNLWQEGRRDFLVLAPDGTDRYAECFDTWEELTESYPDAYYGLERETACHNVEFHRGIR